MRSTNLDMKIENLKIVISEKVFNMRSMAVRFPTQAFENDDNICLCDSNETIYHFNLPGNFYLSTHKLRGSLKLALLLPPAIFKPQKLALKILNNTLVNKRYL